MSEPAPVIRVLESEPPKTVLCEIDRVEYPIAVINKAYSLYMKDDQTPKEIAATLNVPIVVVEYWCQKGDWGKRRLSYAAETHRAQMALQTRYQADERLNTIKKHVEVSRKIIDKAKDTLPNAGTPNAIKALADAVSSAATIEARAVGLAEKVQQVDASGEDSKPAASPLVWIGVGLAPGAVIPPPPQEQSKPVIDVPSESKDAPETPGQS